MNIRIMINDLITVARLLHNITVVAAGSMYATLELDAVQCQKLSDAGIFWTLD